MAIGGVWPPHGPPPAGGAGSWDALGLRAAGLVSVGHVGRRPGGRARGARCVLLPARGGDSALKITVCERHAWRARARGFYFPTDGFVQLRAAALKTINKCYLFNFLWAGLYVRCFLH